MNQEESGNLSKQELFLLIKDKCKSRAQVAHYVGLITLLLIMVALIYSGVWMFRTHETEDIVYFVLFAVFGCTVAWSMMNNYRFLQRFEALDTPEKLLCCYEKRIKSDKIAFFVILLMACTSSGLWYSKMQIIIIGIALIAFSIYLFIKPQSVNRQDRKIIERLRELIEMN